MRPKYCAGILLLIIRIKRDFRGFYLWYERQFSCDIFERIVDLGSFILHFFSFVFRIIYDCSMQIMGRYRKHTTLLYVVEGSCCVDEGETDMIGDRS